MKKSRWRSTLCVCALSVCFAASAESVLVTDTEFGIGPILDVDLFPAATGTFDVGVTFSSINSIAVVISGCSHDSILFPCDTGLGSGEFFVLDLGPDSFTSRGGNPDNPQDIIVMSLSPSSELISDLLDGVVIFGLGAQSIPPFTFDAAVDFANITLWVGGDTAIIPIPAALPMFSLAVACFGLVGWRSCIGA